MAVFFFASCVLFIVPAAGIPLPPLTSRHCPLQVGLGF